MKIYIITIKSMINKVSYVVANWELTISNKGEKPHKNPNKLDWNQNSRRCFINGCSNKVYKTKMSGLCKDHEYHQFDLLLSLLDPSGVNHSIPAHHDMINCLMDWSSTRNFPLSPFFEKLSFAILGNVPDISSLSGEVTYEKYKVKELNEIFESSKKVVEQFFPESNNSSFQPLSTKKGDIPVIVLAHVLMSLIVCEEANRGDRWHCRTIRKDESKTTQLGGAMPIVYFAARSFNWGVEMKNVARNFTPN
ncbi:hypothetical protein G3I01_01720 [Gramella sp. MT6]|uniref:hypothetical protein n=1 Tax=Gramella sp. MT6 TaxID=2705471 RepID=UPI001C5F218D|nr:hypothetical protein [Gramella sp. MT6]QYA24281.1 hypothetical protein G3I01_01720 [Gramella sp. MT6]